MFKSIYQILIIVSVAIGLVQSEHSVAHSIESIISGEHRSDSNKARDAYRNPKKTLEFFGLQEDMTVVEIWPSGGWYAEIIAPYLNESGQYISAGYDPNDENQYFRTRAAEFMEKLNQDPDLYSNVRHTVLKLPDRIEIAKPNSADMVLTFRNIHNWMASDQADAVFEGFFKALKLGGVLGVVEHRGDSSVPQDAEAKSGYVNQEYAIALAEKAGFIFEAASEINANPKDTKNHQEGVWTLAPTYSSVNDQEKKSYSDIGESDRFTLKFRKPE
jgi:predicted methyltransferase